MIYAVLNNTNTVVNVIELNEGANWQPPIDHTVEPLTQGGIDWTFSDGTFVAPNTDEPSEDYD
jgi:hypothetical protein